MQILTCWKFCRNSLLSLHFPGVCVCAGLMLTVCHRTFSGQFRHLSDQFHYLTGQISIGNHIDQTSLLENVGQDV